MNCHSSLQNFSELPFNKCAKHKAIHHFPFKRFQRDHQCLNSEIWLSSLQFRSLEVNKGAELFCRASMLNAISKLCLLATFESSRLLFKRSFLNKTFVLDVLKKNRPLMFYNVCCKKALKTAVKKEDTRKATAPATE